MEYYIENQRFPFGFQSHPKYSRNKHNFPKRVITAKFGSMPCFVIFGGSVLNGHRLPPHPTSPTHLALSQNVLSKVKRNRKK